uniref:Uncharacterized protein n=1 Tax=Ananas comosus var. bracteatus TaxID=296719 RepID=A0A6V7PTI2_ANACO|nr:unnamed protein product [Ananas comosus var. bracteatus]
MLLEVRSLPCFQLVFDVATFESSIDSVKLDIEYFKYSRSSLTEPIDDSKVATSKISWKHERLCIMANEIPLNYGTDPTHMPTIILFSDESRNRTMLSPLMLFPIPYAFHPPPEIFSAPIVLQLDSFHRLFKVEP